MRLSHAVLKAPYDTSFRLSLKWRIFIYFCLSKNTLIVFQRIHRFLVKISLLDTIKTGNETIIIIIELDITLLYRFLKSSWFSKQISKIRFDLIAEQILNDGSTGVKKQIHTHTRTRLTLVVVPVGKREIR